MNKKAGKPPLDPRQDDQRRLATGMALYSAIITDLVGFPGAGIALGWFLWKKWNAPMILMLVFGLIGFALGIQQIFLIAKKTSDQQDSDANDSRK